MLHLPSLKLAWQSLRKSPWAALTTLILVMLLLATVGQCTSWRKRAKEQEKHLDAYKTAVTNLEQALAVKPTEVIVNSYLPPEVVKSARRKKITPLASTALTSSTVSAGDPCQPPVDTVGAETANSRNDAVFPIAPLTDRANLTHADLTVRLDGAVHTFALPPRYELFTHTILNAHLERGDWKSDVTFSEDAGNLNVVSRYNKELTQALSDHASERHVTLGVRPVRQWRTGWVAGVGAAYDGTSVQPAAFVGYGVSF